MKLKLPLLAFLILGLFDTACSQIVPIADTLTSPVMGKSTKTATFEQVTAILPPAATPSPVSTATAISVQHSSTFTPSLSPTAKLAPTLESTSTSTAEFSSQGPHLLVDSSPCCEGNGPLLILNADGSGGKLIKLPVGGHIIRVDESISPNGQWLAYFTGSIEESHDLTLNLFNLSNQTTLEIAQLFSPEYPDILLELADSLARNDPEYPDPKEWLVSLNMSLESTIGNLAWSPDGRFLAFSGQMEGPSTDLYLYELETQIIHKITEEPQFIYGFLWSPDSLWIAISVGYPGIMFDFNRLHIVRSRDRQVRWLRQISSIALTHTSEWLSKDFLFTLGGWDGGDPWHLELLDIQKDQVVEFWPETVLAYAADIENRTIALCGVPYWLPKQEEGEAESSERLAGLYFVSMDNVQDHRKISEDFFWSLYFIGGSQWQYIGWDEKNVVGISRDGRITPFYKSKSTYTQVLISPDRRWVAIYGEGEGVNLFSNTGELMLSLKTQSQRIVWRLDSSGLFISSDKVYYLPLLPDGSFGSLTPVNGCNKNCTLYHAAWIP
jgi:dipeptidyl aminopeptidase/acylaminoacyl peptidase